MEKEQTAQTLAVTKAPAMQDIMTHDELHYFGDATGENIELGGVIPEMTENSNPKEKETHYIHQKSGSTTITGFNNEFAITMDMVKGDKVFDDFYQIFYQRKTGEEAKRDHYIVNTWEPIEMQANKYKARKIHQTVSITECTGVAGEQKQISGSLKGGDFEYGTFDTSTKIFTPNE